MIKSNPFGEVTPQDLTRSTHCRATDPRVDRVIAAVAAGLRSIDKAWHQLRGFRPPLEQWEAFATVCRALGRTSYSKHWARHQWLCWTELSDEGTYPEQRAKWLERQREFAGAMAAKASASPVRTNAQIRALSCQQPEPDHAQLALFA